jgi:hypothetical protein
MKRNTLAAAVLALAAPAWANPPGYDSSWTSKEAADAAAAADKDYSDCVFQHLQKYARKTQEPVVTIVPAAVAACQFARMKLLSAMRKAQPTWPLDWLDRRDREVEPDEMSIVLEARSK